MASKGPSSKLPVPATEPVPQAAKRSATASVAAKVAATRAVPKSPVVVKSAPLPAAAPPPDAVADAASVVIPPTPEIVPESVAAPAAAVIKKEVITMEATIQSAAEKAQADAKTMFTDVNDRAKTVMEKGSKMVEDMSEFSKGNVEAMVESSKIAAKGAEDVAKYTTDYIKATVEKANAAARTFASVKSPTELFKLQSDYAKEAMDSVMAETAKFTEHYLKLLGEIAQPISNRVAVAAEKMKIAA